MRINFTKYQGTGNDFVLIDNRDLSFPKENLDVIRKLADRKFGIGADGVMLIESHAECDFRMIYFNSDGSQSLCGNGSRCAIDFSHSLGLITDQATFETTDGMHTAQLKNDWVHFGLHDVSYCEIDGYSAFIDNGSPHHIVFVDNVADIDVRQEGSKIRYSDKYAPAGTNVNFAQILDGSLKVRTYERGVENETLSCGTGVTAAAIAASFKGIESPVTIETLGGTLSVSFHKSENNYFSEIYLAGPATKVFVGSIDI